MSDETDALWQAVDAITQPTKRRIPRAADADWLEELRTDPGVTVCRVEAYRAATLAYGEIPALWDQATWALTTGSESSGGGGSPLRERSPADLDLMETMLTIRESMAWQLPGRGKAWRKPGDMPDMMRELASYVVAHEPQHVQWWAYRFAQWARLLQAHLHALDQGPKPVRLRGAPCPLCRTRTVTIDGPSGPVVVPAILIDFTDKWIRAAQCTACDAVWWRGEELNELADLLAKNNEGQMTA